MSGDVKRLTQAEASEMVREITAQNPNARLPEFPEMKLPEDCWPRLLEWAVVVCSDLFHRGTDVLDDDEASARTAALEVRLRGNASGQYDLDAVLAHHRALRAASVEAAFALGKAIGARQGVEEEVRLRCCRLSDELHLIKDRVEDVELLDVLWNTAVIHPKKRQKLANLIADMCMDVGARIDAVAEKIHPLKAEEPAA